MGLADFIQQQQVIDANKNQMLRNNLRSDQEQQRQGLLTQQNIAESNQNMAINRTKTETGLQDRAIKAFTAFNDLLGGVATLEDPRQYKEALNMVYSTPLAKIVDPDGEGRSFFEDQNKAKSILPSMRGLSVLKQEGADREALALKAQDLLVQMERVKQSGQGTIGANERLARQIQQEYADRGEDISLEKANNIARGFGGDRVNFEREKTSAVEDAKYKQALTTSYPKALASLKASQAKFSNIKDTIKRAYSLVAPLSASFGSETVANFSGSQAKDLRKLIDTVRANLAFNELQEMRANSPTGGALGSVTERELDLLSSVYQNIDANQSIGQLKTNLLKLFKSINDSESRVSDAFSTQYKDFIGNEAPQETLQQPSPQGEVQGIKFLGFE